jgi:hypothetical protein
MTASGQEPLQILLASPREPSGGSWLINCLLELGIRVNFKPVLDRVWRSVNTMREPAAMWEPAGDGRWRLHPRADSLRKWLPILSRCETLRFRDDVAVFYVQDIARPDFTGQRSALFVRDPRDAIHSLYKRNRPDQSLDEFVRFPHPETLLDAIAQWRLFVESWLTRDGLQVYRFEDYKRDAVALLTRILDELGIAATAADIARAAAESSYEKARAAEEKYRAEHPGDDEVAMRAGRVGEWQDQPETQALSREIEARLHPLLARLGYRCETSLPAENLPEGLSQQHFLSAFKNLEVPDRWRAAAAAADPMTCPQLPDILARASRIDATTIARVRLQTREARQLLDSLSEYALAWQQQQRSRAEAVRNDFENGADYQMTRIRELASRLKARRRRTGEAARNDSP